MRQIDAFTFFELGSRLHKVDAVDYLSLIGEGTSKSAARWRYYDALTALDDFLKSTLLNIRTSRRSGDELRKLLVNAFRICSEEGKAEEFVDYSLGSSVTSALIAFETNLKSKLGIADLFMVDQKAAFDTRTIVWEGDRAFQPATQHKCPEAIEDMRNAMRCIAFELPTAAAFHLHCAHELVLRKYWDSVMAGQARPSNNSLGTYIDQLEKSGNASESVISALRDVKNLHRNPVIHADLTLGNADEAIDLQSAIRYSIGAMLNYILLPTPSPNATSLVE